MTQCVPLYYDDGGEFEPLPEWSQFLIDVGRAVKGQERGLRVGLALPTRAYAAVLVATGVVIAGGGSSANHYSSEEHLEQLANLPIGTPVIYYRDNRKITGIFQGWQMEKGERRFVIQVDTAASAYRLLPERLHAVEVAPFKLDNLPRNAAHRRVKANVAFLASLLTDRNVTDFVRRATIECVVLGRINMLCRETLETNLATRSSDDRLTTGTFQDILRVRQFSAKTEAFRTDILPVGRSQSESSISSSPVIVFDGANGFLRWRDNWRGSSQVVVLDRTDRYFQRAADAFNQQYVTRADDANLPLRKIPEGVEVVAFREEI